MASTTPQKDKGADLSTAADTSNVEAADLAVGPGESTAPAKANRKAAEAKPTRLDEAVDMPGYVAPGDGPFDTTDPMEHATSVVPDKGAAAREGFGVVNAVQPIADPSGRTQAIAQGLLDGDEGDARTETYETMAPNGKMVKVHHNIDTGETRLA